MKNSVTLYLFLLFLCILQTALFPRVFETFERHTFFFFLAGHTVDFLLLFTIYLGMHREHWALLIWIFFISVTASSFGLAWNGAALASLLLVGLLCSLVRPHLLLENGTMVLIFVAIVSLLEAPLHLQMGALLARTPGIFRGVWGFLLIQVVINALAAPLCFWGLSAIDQATGAGPRRRGELLL